MPTPKLSEKELQKTVDKFTALNIPQLAVAARKMNMPVGTLKHRLDLAGYKPSAVVKKEREFETPELPSESRTIDELRSDRLKESQRVSAAWKARNLIPIQIKKKGPIGILHFGDPHLDDPGCDWQAIENHVDLINSTDGLFAVNVGDTTNNWVGRLARLYAVQQTTTSEAWTLAEWFFNACPWLYVIGGNHDAWAGDADPLKWIARQSSALYESSEARIELALPTGQKVRINARHDFAGHSMWNAAHGVSKSQIMGVRDHISICGHKHVSAYNINKDPSTGITMHAIQVASYKLFDRYAKERGFRDQTLSPCAVTTINTDLPETSPDFIKVFWDAEAGADYLTFLRSRQ